MIILVLKYTVVVVTSMILNLTEFFLDSRPDYPRRQMKNGKGFNYELQEAQGLLYFLLV